MEGVYEQQRRKEKPSVMNKVVSAIDKSTSTMHLNDAVVRSLAALTNVEFTSKQGRQWAEKMRPKIDAVAASVGRSAAAVDLILGVVGSAVSVSQFGLMLRDDRRQAANSPDTLVDGAVTIVNHIRLTRALGGTALGISSLFRPVTRITDVALRFSEPLSLRVAHTVDAILAKREKQKKTIFVGTGRP